MAIFAVLADKPSDELGRRIAALYPDDHYVVSANQWLISADTITQTLAENLDVRTGTYGRVLVLGATGSSSGWHAKSAWEWLTQKTKSS